AEDRVEGQRHVHQVQDLHHDHHLQVRRDCFDRDGRGEEHGDDSGGGGRGGRGESAEEGEEAGGDRERGRTGQERRTRRSLRTASCRRAATPAGPPSCGWMSQAPAPY
ncbi:unnamed protein product, partial [Musa textilis]